MRRSWFDKLTTNEVVVPVRPELVEGLGGPFLKLPVTADLHRANSKNGTPNKQTAIRNGSHKICYVILPRRFSVHLHNGTATGKRSNRISPDNVRDGFTV